MSIQRCRARFRPTAAVDARVAGSDPRAQHMKVVLLNRRVRRRTKFLFVPIIALALQASALASL
jgi:hypothetical protein